jgi:hypothetical protein
MTSMVKLVYVGNKPVAYDNIARSGKSWNGNGDVQEVTEVQARQLLKFPDQWQLADEADRESVEHTESIKIVDEDGDQVIIDPDSFKKPLEKMTKAEMVAYANDRWGKKLDVTLAKKMMIDQIEEWQHDLDVTIGGHPEK